MRAVCDWSFGQNDDARAVKVENLDSIFAPIAKVKQRVSPEQYQMFDLCVYKQWPVKRIAKQLGVSRGSVYLARHRITSLLKQEVKAMEKKMI